MQGMLVSEEKHMKNKWLRTFISSSFVVHSLSNKDAAPGVYLNTQRRVACAVMHVCHGQLERDDSLSTCFPLLFCFLATSLRQHSGEISSMLDSSSSFTNSKAFLQTCLKNDIIYIRDCFTYFCKRENHYINPKSHALCFPFLTS